ncbi:MAG: hypothetical protein CMB74_03695 [Euryarchaeota archaeon]|nr:hypothetical protein [Euryarchaeota archaeon]
MNEARNRQSKSTSALFSLMLVLSTVLVGMTPTVQAVGPNQNDLNSGGDLPDNTSVNITNYIFTGSFSGSGELDYGDDEDYLRVALNANEGLSATLSFPSTTTFANGTTVTNDFDLIFYESNLTMMGASWATNPETLSTNSSTVAHGGMVYISIYRYQGVGTWNLTLTKFTVGSTGGGGGGSSVSNCTGAGTLTSDILEPNDSTSTATPASLLPLSCTGLSIHSSTDTDYFEVDMVAGVTYYVNVTFNGAVGDLDTGWDTATGGFLASSGTTGNLESMQVTAFVNQTTYVDVYGWQGATNTYDIEITTDNPGGGQAFESVDIAITNTTHATLSFSGLTNGTTYNYNHTYGQIHLDGEENWGSSTNGSFTANGTTHSINITTMATNNESVFAVTSTLFNAANASLNTDTETLYIEMVEIEATSSTTGDIELTNLTVGGDYVVEWIVVDYDEWLNNFAVSNDVNAAINDSMIDSDMWYLMPTTSSMTYQITWTGPTTMNDHLFSAYISQNGTAVNLSDNDNLTGLHFYEFIPQLPSLTIASYSASATAATNNVQAEGLDLVVGDGYQYQYRVTDASGANIATSTMTSFTATAQNQSMPTFTYNTPNASGTYCVHIDLYSNVSVQLIGDSDCFTLVQDDDNDGVPNESDACPNTATGAIVDQNGCALSQKDTDNDGYNDDVDAFPNDATQWSDMDGDGYGDNASGNMADAFPTDGTQWSDADGDGYGDNANGNYPDAFPTDPTQWSDTDGDGYGDNASGNNPDEWPSDGTQWKDSDGDGFGDNPTGTNGDAFPNDASQWSDADGDGYGDNPNGTTPDAFPADGTQWEDSDGDGYGDNPQGDNADAFPDDSSQWSDGDGDGYGDNQAGTNPDAFPNDSTQWSDTDGDGYGDNQAGLNADAFPNDATQWRDADGDGYGDNANGNNPDLCLDTPAGEAVDGNGCSLSQLDADMDGVSDADDACPDTPAGETVDSVGCSSSQEDADNDGVMDAFDACPNTPLGAVVNAAGCATSQLDTDGDTITDDRDQCPTTTAGEPVNGVGCAASERDTDDDGVVDANDVCDFTPASETADAQGCAPSQKDSDGDDVTDDVDNCPGTGNGLSVDLLGCATNQRDADSDGISDADDTCPVTPAEEQVDPAGCSQSQKDEDLDDIMNNMDLCPDTPVTQSVDVDGCSEQQKDDDEDGIKNHVDECPNTPEGELIDAAGCALIQLDSDGDGVNDAEDAFKFDANESADSDNDGVADRWDAYPEDPTRSQAAVKESGNGMLYAIIALLLVGLLGGGGYFYTRKPELAATSPFGDAMDAMDSATEQNMAGASKDVPNLDASSPQQWEENGVHWSRDANGNLSYYDAQSGQWVAYQG